MLRKLRRSCGITHKGLHAPQLMIALTLMLMLSGLMAPIASTIEAAPSSSQADELASAALQSQDDDDEEENTDNTVLRPSNNIRVNTTNLQLQQNQTLQPLQPIDTDEPDDEELPQDDNQPDGDQTDDQEETSPESTELQPAGFKFNLYWCGNDVDLANAQPNDFATGESLKSACSAQAAPVTVRLTSKTTNTEPMTNTVVQFPGSLTFSPLGVDDWKIEIQPHVVVPEDLFNCNGLTPYGNTKPYATYARIAPDQSQYDMDTLSEEVITCDWFGQIPDTNNLNITKWNCPEAFDFATQGYEVAKGTCWDDVNPPVEFTVKSIEPNVTFEQMQATDPNNNDETYFSEIPAGAFELSEKVPDGYGLIAVYCSVNTQPAVETLLSAENMIRVEATGGNAIRCDFFDQPGASASTMGDTPSDSGVSLTIYKWLCPAGTNQTETDPSYYSGECATQLADVPFTVADANGDHPILSDIDGVQIDNLVPNPDGTITIVEQTPSGYAQPIAFCRPLNGELMQMPIALGGTILYTTADEVSYQCNWYNIPTQMMPQGDTPSGSGVSLTIYKWLCPAGTDQTSTDPSYYSGECATQLADVPFTVTDSVGDHPVLSDIDGVQIDNLVPNPDGTITIVEQTPSGYAQPVAFCRPLNGELMQMPIALGGTILYTTADEVSYQCNWYNIPTSGGTGDVKIWKWDCGNAFITDSNADATNFDWLRANCTTPQNDVTFSLGFLTSTTSNGYTEFLGVDPGTYNLTETVPAGYAVVAASCGLTSNLTDPANVVYGGLMTLSDGTVSIETQANHIVYCQWFNKPVGNGEIQIKKWDCGDAVLPQKADNNWLETNCTTPQDGVTFTVNTNPEKSATTVGGVATITDVPEGDYQLSEMIPDGYGEPAVACALVSNLTNPDDVSFALVPKSTGTNNAVDIQMLADHIVYCNWYNIPVNEFSLTIYKWECPEGTDATSTDPSYFSGICDTEQAGVPFTIYDGSMNSPISTTSDTNGRQIDNLLPDANSQIQIQEDIPSGYGTPVVFCQQLNDNAPTQYTVTNGRVTVAAPSNDDLQCFWYNIPDPGNTVHVTKWECPEGTELNPMPTLQWFQDNCQTRLAGVNFTLQSGAMSSTLTTDMDGEAKFNSVPAGMMTLMESIPMGYNPNPVVVCSGTAYINGAVGDMFPNFVSAPGGSWTFNMTEGQWTIHCDFYNIPETPSTVIIYKWSCPEGVKPEPTIQWHQDNCTMAMDGVDFTLTDVVGPRTLTTSGGMVTFNDVATGPIQIKETIPSGYSNQPFLVCQFTYADGSGTGQYSPTPVNGVYNTSIDQPGSVFRCDWYNHKVGPGEITVYKWTCPEGYDRTAWGADPMVDCTQATNGITFQLIQNPPAVLSQSDTGDSISGAVYFGGLEPDSYILNEILTPEQSMNLKEAFIWQCYGLTTSSVQPYPLNIGQIFQFDIVGGDNIICHWFNVPKTPHGWLDVTKFNCTTEKYVADVYCYTNQTGQEFNLQKWDGANWNTIASGITDVNGKLSFPGLDEGDYRLVEPNKEACMIKSSNITPNKNIGVKKGEGTTVYVYNCKTPPPPNDTPKKYPNTGVDPSSAETQELRMPGVELAGLIGLAGVSMSRRRFLKRAAGVTLGAGALALPAVAAQELLPLDSTPAPATPGANVLGCGTPMAMTDDTIIEPIGEGTPTWEDPCLRGAIPLRFRVPIIGVDAAVEYLEIIDGQMQPPSGAEDVTWYKETSRLGEVGNGIYAGHLNYWGIPEGVFFRLESLKEGDVIEIDGNDAKTYSYIVQWMQNFPSDEEPPEEALGTTNERAITVITCGGEWVSSRAEYDHRTLVRAVQMEDPV